MKGNPTIPIDFSRPVSRPTLLSLLSTALRVKEFRFARQVSLAWLAVYPGDLRVNLVLAQSLLGEEKFSQVAPIIESLCQKDPEFILAQRVKTNSAVVKDPEMRKIALACLYALGSDDKATAQLPEWASHTRVARQALQSGDIAKAENFIHQALAVDPPTPIPAILHVQVTRASLDRQATRNLANVYFTRWPECIPFKLYVAESKIESGDESGAVAMLHQCVASDAAGQVPTRIWGTDHPYRPLWPARMEIPFDIAIPASISGQMGWNQLGGGLASSSNSVEENLDSIPVTNPDEPSAPPEEKAYQSKGWPEFLRAIQAELERLAIRLRRPEVAQSDGRFPVYVVFSTLKGLQDQYGPQTAAVIDSEMKKLAEAVGKRSKWGSLVYYADDPASVAALGVKPVPYNDPWKLKLALTDLDKALAKKGEMIGALLIVGGPSVVPFHRLPNPTEDGDAEIASDNPYASLDNNYFIPEWPLGRLPGGIGSDAGMLLDSIRKMTAFHIRVAQPKSLFESSRLFRSLASRVKVFFKGKDTAVKPSFGYSASVWRDASMSVYETIGDPQKLLTSPPMVSGTLVGTRMVPSDLSYFNLHGLADAPEWYGQRDLGDPAGPDYPVALSPRDVLNTGRAPRFVFSEACYGSHIENKSEDQALSLKFISSGSMGMVGSTCISYGSVSTPLIAADLLGQSFWKNLLEGKPAGEALKQAKIALVQEMKKRQGFLDGEDQKTLLSFILYGDPLASIEENAPKMKVHLRQHVPSGIKTVSDREAIGTKEMISDEIINQVKAAVDEYLPGLHDAEMNIRFRQGITLDNGSKKRQPKVTPQSTIVTMSKRIEAACYCHTHYARMTLDRQGKVVKLSMSR